MLIDIADLDVIYLTYDEPNREENWIKIQNMVPWATRVDGVKGSDAAHKAAASASSTDRFIPFLRSLFAPIRNDVALLPHEKWSKLCYYCGQKTF